MYDASNRKDIRKAEKEALRDEHERVEWLRQALSSVGGRSWFHNLLEACHLFSDPFTGQALTEAYLKGERNVGLRIFADIVNNCPDQYLLMMRESNARDTARQLDRSQIDGGDDSGSEPDPDYTSNLVDYGDHTE